MEDIHDGLLQQDLVINEAIKNDPFLLFIREKTGEHPRKILAEANVKTCFAWVNKMGMLEEARDWFIKTENERGFKLANRAIEKHAIGQCVWDSSAKVYTDYTSAIISRNLSDMLHPKYDRSLTIREAFHMMGFPHDFELLGGVKNVQMISQNVPVCTAQDMVHLAKRFLEGGLPLSENDFVRQNNMCQKTTFHG